MEGDFFAETAAGKISTAWKAHSRRKNLKNSIRHLEKPVRLMLLRLNDIPTALVKQNSEISVVVSFWWSSLSNSSTKSTASTKSSNIKDIIKSIQPNSVCKMGPFSVRTQYNDEADGTTSSISTKTISQSRIPNSSLNTQQKCQEKVSYHSIKEQYISSSNKTALQTLEFEDELFSPSIQRISQSPPQRSSSHNHISHENHQNISDILTSIMSHIPWPNHHQQHDMERDVGVTTSGKSDRCGNVRVGSSRQVIPTATTSPSSRRAMKLICNFQNECILLPGCWSNFVVKVEINENNHSIGNCVIDTSTVGGLEFRGGRLLIKVDPSSGSFLTRSSTNLLRIVPNAVSPAPSMMTLELGLYRETTLETTSQWVHVHVSASISHFGSSFHIFGSPAKKFDRYYLCLDHSALYIYSDNNIPPIAKILHTIVISDILTVSGPSKDRTRDGLSGATSTKSTRRQSTSSGKVVNNPAKPREGEIEVEGEGGRGRGGGRGIGVSCGGCEEAQAVGEVVVEGGGGVLPKSGEVRVVTVDKRIFIFRFEQIREAKIWTRVLQRLIAESSLSKSCH